MDQRQIIFFIIGLVCSFIYLYIFECSSKYLLLFALALYLIDKRFTECDKCRNHQKKSS